MPINESNLEGMFTFETGEKPRSEDPPFHLLVLGDFAGDVERAPLERRRPFAIDRDNFGQTMARLKVSARLDMKGGGSMVIGFSDIDDFHPDSLFRNVREFSELREIRRQLKSADGFDEAAARVRSWFAVRDERSAAPDEAANSVSADEDDLLDMILAAPAASRADDSDLGRLVSAIVAPHVVRIDEDEQKRLISVVDNAVSELMRSILHHPRFQALEAAWRGLFLLVRKVETDSELRIFAWDVPKHEFTDDLKSVGNLGDSAAYREWVRETVETPGGEAYAAIGADYSFGLNVEDVAALMRIAKLVQAAGAPFVARMYPEIFGIGSFAETIDPAMFKAQEGNQNARLWEALRESPEAANLGLGLNGFLGRLPYGRRYDTVETFEFEEFDGDFGHSDLLWINPAFGLLLVLAQSFRRAGWEMGRSLVHDLSGLPFVHYESNGETLTVPCGETVMTESMNERILEAGLIPLLTIRDTDRIKIGRIQSIQPGGRKLAGRWN